MNVYEKALETFGEDKQIDKCIEEMAELTQALLRYKYDRSHNCEEEIADVGVTLEQMKLVFNIASIEKWQSTKEARLALRIEDEIERKKKHSSL